jgi:hypothetical protein
VRDDVDRQNYREYIAARSLCTDVAAARRTRGKLGQKLSA